MLGTFARVEKRVIDNKCVAYKIYSRAHGSLVYQHFLRERDTLKQLNITNKDSYKHHIIELLDVQETNTHHVLIFPFYDTTLESFVHTKNKTLAHQFLDQISKALSYIHQQGIVHCDLSPQNILLGSGCMFLSDFGCAQRINTPHTTTDIGTRLYKAPEHLFGYRTYSSSTDLWSFGVIFLQLMIGYPIFAGESDIEQIARIVFRLGRPSLEGYAITFIFIFCDV
ncbi:kinase-like domain-containing protein [Gilbertella persicaria]|uniref:kinase-like domain-containing protein n=1 Tax=Gilbertella persicaria TaxID=101096 RepID=UPI00221ED9E0|nr:kinase-like domain-containing protein [Gilbertella persicaria]KAI8084318.1 kinase-like domain-containing protein [Gilbertella persicaria]